MTMAALTELRKEVSRAGNLVDCWEQSSVATTAVKRADKRVDTTELPMATSWADTKAVCSEQPMVVSMVAMTETANWVGQMDVHREWRWAGSSASSMAATELQKAAVWGLLNGCVDGL